LVQRIVRISAIAALYSACTVVVMLFLGWFSWGPVQLRISEALTVLALFTPDAVCGLGLGCAIANIINIPLSGVGTLGLLDVVFGTLATVLGACFAWRFRDNPPLAVAGPVITNGLIVPAYLPLMLKGMGFYTIPLTSISLDGSYVAMYVFGLVATSIGEAAVMYILGLPLYRALRQSPVAEVLAEPEGAIA
jgi:uncharacterized membrane protein